MRQEIIFFLLVFSSDSVSKATVLQLNISTNVQIPIHVIHQYVFVFDHLYLCICIHMLLQVQHKQNAADAEIPIGVLLMRPLLQMAFEIATQKTFTLGPLIFAEDDLHINRPTDL